MSAYSTCRLPPKSLTEAEQTALLKITGEHARSYRDHMLFALAVGTGLRQSELLALNVGDVRNVHGKARRRIVLRVYKRCTEKPTSQEVILPGRLVYKLERFFKWKAKQGESLGFEEPLFVSRNKRRLSERMAREAFRLWQKRADW